MIEVEIKARIDNPDEIVKSLKKLGAIYLISLEHQDTYFNMPRKLRDFRKTDEALRIRKSREFNKESSSPNERIEKYYLTYKGAKIDTETKTRKEHEVLFQDGEILREILKILKFREIITVEKQRELYKIKYKQNEIECLIDYLPILDSNFIELEIDIEKDEDKLSNKTDIMFSLLEDLGLSRENSIRKSYLELIVDKLRKVEKK